ncbi:hypothetical protein Tco_0791168 [Tanacetum coccineum]
MSVPPSFSTEQVFQKIGSWWGKKRLEVVMKEVHSRGGEDDEPFKGMDIEDKMLRNMTAEVAVSYGNLDNLGNI